MFDQAEAILRVGVEKNALRTHAWINVAAPSVVGRLRGLVDLMRRSGALRAAVSVVGIMTALALRPEPGRLVGATSVRARALVLSAQARRYLSLQYRAYLTEFMVCMIGPVRGDAVIVERIAPADVDPAQSTPTRVLPRQTCEDAGWAGTVAAVPSHPGVAHRSHSL